MAKLPVISGKDLIKILTKSGFEVVRRKGSHVSLQKEKYRTVVPLHNELAKGTLLAILRQCGMSRNEFEKLV
ncbi:MAG: type II toxin-antitoxin system HicA family toxin [Elusimicrobiota bacterium]|nr:type II toxin-antitoxin system HicA family toxin [Elusimicrobiota bacterium]